MQEYQFSPGFQCENWSSWRGKQDLMLSSLNTHLQGKSLQKTVPKRGNQTLMKSRSSSSLVFLNALRKSNCSYWFPDIFCVPTAKPVLCFLLVQRSSPFQAGTASMPQRKVHLSLSLVLSTLYRNSSHRFQGRPHKHAEITGAFLTSPLLVPQLISQKLTWICHCALVCLDSHSAWSALADPS